MLRTTLLFVSLLPALTAAPMLRLASTTVGPVSVAVGANGPSQTVEAYNAGDGTLNLKLSSSVPWMAGSVGATTACTARPGNCIPIQIALPTASLSKGMYTGILTVSDPNAVDAPQTITVTVQVGGGVPDRVDFFLPPNGSSAEKKFSTNSQLTGQVSTQNGRPWLSFSLDGFGTFHFVVPYHIVATGLSGMGDGDYNGSVTISNSSFAPDNKTVPVVLHVTSQPIAAAQPEKLKFKLLQNSAAASQTLTLSNTGLGTLSISEVKPGTTPAANWLSAESAGDLSYKISVDPAGLAAGNYEGSLAIASNAANGPLVVPVELQVAAPGPPLAFFGGVVNNATFGGGESVSQGDICALFGEQLSNKDPQIGDQLPLVTQLGGATVFVNDQATPLYFSSQGQINFQMPYETPPGTALVRVDRDGQRGNTVSVQVAARAARLLRLGIGDYGIIINYSDGSFPIPAATAASAGISGHPVHAGDILIMFAIGLGQTSPPVVSGVAAPDAEPLARVEPKPKVVFGGGPIIPGIPSDPPYVGLTPYFVGLYQINVTVPAGVKPGDNVPVYLAGDGITSNQVSIAIE